jgi:sugar O-acyltransferase (sialic acid O-acetyltransferase NeuD family)
MNCLWLIGVKIYSLFDLKTLGSRKLVIIGDSDFAQIAYHYFNDDTEYEVVGFSVEKEFLSNTELFNLPVIPFDQLTKIFPAESHSIFVAITYGQMNRLRARLVGQARKLGYSLASYISPRAFVSKHCKIGEHCFIFENNVIQPFAELGDNVILWSGNHIGHHSKIGDHCFVSSHVVISGHVSIGQFCFLGVNATIVNNINIAADCWVGPAAVVNRDAELGSLFPPVDSQPSAVSTHKFFKVSIPAVSDLSGL